MIYNEINGAPMSQEKIDAYLKRIDMPFPENLDLAYLSRLQWSHMCHIPFENLDIMAGLPLSLNREDLYCKVIERSRGGVCSELNTLYNWLLESLGFEVVSYSSRIIAKTLPIQTQSHRVMGVQLDGKTYLTDVGFNFEHHRIPLLLEENLIQPDGECEYKLVRDEFWGWVMWQNRPGEGWRRKLGFTEEPHIDLDFVPATFYASSHPDSRINKCTKVSLYIDNQFYAIRSGSFLREHGGVEEIIEPALSKEREGEILKDIFGLSAGD
ncbi:arylamine N-acetyltransferase [Anaerovorax odorimutans]|uniref:Arylamine N-acetyltransferase n=1 Tax=Anaerovorax odorimutans TaxID=109327 RepID=A0ABT1RNH8_9FIRM|nr:arylamine N-acetyltransferase [Anaerovorax odorimutans]MCQ4636741.1 arylamine N-acetyltransferase [Anaerovorax odorimutans]